MSPANADTSAPAGTDATVAREQTRARYPDETGYITRDGVRVHWERYGDGSPTILLLPTWSILHSRHWKAQIAYLARHFRVVTFDGRGNGRSDRPTDPGAYDGAVFAADAIDVLDATGTDRAILAGMSMGAGYALQIATRYPERVAGAVFIGPSVGLADPTPGATYIDLDDEPPAWEGWYLYSAAAWRRDWPGFAEWFFGQVFNEPHSTKQIEDAVGWASETDPETIITGKRAAYLPPLEPAKPSASADLSEPAEPPALAYARRVRCPSLVIHGSADAVSHVSGGRRLAEALGAPLVVLHGSGHDPQGRDPVRINLLIAEFVRRLAAADG
jgi:pimeloyl-ACP methyl ester carboxylesterase